MKHIIFILILIIKTNLYSQSVDITTCENIVENKEFFKALIHEKFESIQIDNSVTIEIILLIKKEGYAIILNKIEKDFQETIERILRYNNKWKVCIINQTKKDTIIRIKLKIK